MFSISWDIPARARALRLKGVIAARAKARQVGGLKRGDELPVPVNLPERERGDTRDALAAAAGVSGRTIDKVEAVERDALAGKPADPVANLPQGKTRDVVAFVALRLVG